MAIIKAKWKGAMDWVVYYSIDRSYSRPQPYWSTSITAAEHYPDNIDPLKKVRSKKLLGQVENIHLVIT
jgi:hypothetical protein